MKKVKPKKRIKAPGFTCHPKDPEVMKFIYDRVLSTGMTIQSIVEQMLLHAMAAKSLKLKRKEPSTIKRQLDAHARKIEKIKERMELPA